jgi:hypothetical protein
MSYWPITQIKFADSPAIDAFDRLRVSQPVTQFNSKLLWDKAPLIYDEATTGAGATAAYQANKSMVRMSTTASTTGSVTRQSFRRFNYQPGKSQLIILTANVNGLEADNTKQVGLFDDNNGLFFEFTDTAGVVVRTYTSGSAVNTRVAQASWNIDPMDGTGPSGYTVDWTKVQIFVIDYEWLGVGRVRYGMVLDGILYYVHETAAANSGTLVYMTTPNLPIRYALSNNGSGDATNFDQICSTVMVEGGVDPTGTLHSVNSGTSGIAMSAGDRNAMFAVRLASDHLDSIIAFLDYSIASTSANALVLTELIMDPTVAGSPVWNTTAYDELDYYQGTPSTHTVTNGEVVYSQFSIGKTSFSFEKPDPAITLGQKIDGTSQVLVLAVTCVANATVATAMNWTVLS